MLRWCVFSCHKWAFAIIVFPNDASQSRWLHGLFRYCIATELLARLLVRSQSARHQVPLNILVCTFTNLNSSSFRLIKTQNEYVHTHRTKEQKKKKKLESTNHLRTAIFHIMNNIPVAAAAAAVVFIVSILIPFSDNFLSRIKSKWISFRNALFLLFFCLLSFVRWIISFFL